MNAQFLGALQKASNETPRNINRRLILDLIRKLQPISRADLARESGLQRSTVSLIIADLITDEWVVEGNRDRLRLGRRPTLLRLGERRGVIVVDVHPNRAILAIGNIDGSLGTRTEIPLSDMVRTASKQIGAAVRKLMKTNPERLFIGVGISVPGAVDDSQKLIFAPNLAWANYDIRSVLQRETGLRCEIENAANTCLLGELWFHDALNAQNIALLAVAEGMGGAIVNNGYMLRGINGLAGEIGHMILDEKGPRCHCGARGCWEAYASNRAAERYYKALRGRGPQVSYKVLLQMASQGDRLAAQALKQMAVQIGRGLRTLIAAYSPEVIIISGELTAQWQLFAPILERAVQRHTLAGSAPKLVPALDGALSRLRGGIALVLQR